METTVKIKTNDVLLKALENASYAEQSDEELFEQRVSFIYSSMNKDSGMTRSKIEDILVRQRGSLKHKQRA